jgi:hypothetical protein
MSTAPTNGMSANAQSRVMPTNPKYGIQASFVRMPKAPCPMKQAAAPSRRVQ